MKMETLAVSGIMDINTRVNICMIFDLLDTLSNLSLIPKINKISVDPDTGKFHITYTILSVEREAK